MNFCKIFTSSLLVYTCLFSEKTFGQGNFLPGYIISTVNDTTEGFIRYEHWDASPIRIDFKANLEMAPVQKLGTDHLTEFGITSVNETYKNKRIGIINIDPTYEYMEQPSVKATDSATVFLRVLTRGENVSLLSHKRSRESAHYFLEKDKVLTELINYPYRGMIRGRIYLLTYDEYKRQLPALLSDSAPFNEPLPKYSEKSLKEYVEKYNQSTGEVKSTHDEIIKDDFLIDLLLAGGVESWKEPGLDLEKKVTFGAGIRVNLPRKGNNRYLRAALFFIPNMSTKEVYSSSSDEKLNLKTLEFGAGTHFGFRKLRPFAGIDYCIGLDGWRSVIFAPHAGISYNRKLSLEVSHFANLGSAFSPAPFFNRPRISFNYYLNLNSLFGKK